MGCGLAVPGIGEHGGLPEEAVAPRQRDGQAEGSLCPVEERTAQRSPFARRITSFPGMEESGRVKGRAPRGRELHQGQKERRERGRLEGGKAQQACQKPAIQVGLGTSCFIPSLPPLPVPAACQQARRARGQEVLACFPVVTKRQGRRSTFLHPTPSLSSCPDREQGDALLPHPPFSLPPHPIPRCDVPHRGLQGSCVVQGTQGGVGGSTPESSPAWCSTC